MKRFIFLLFCLLASIWFVSAQTTRITGTVISADDNDPVIGASIVVKSSTSVGTITNVNGEFTLNVPSNATTLIVSYIGMKTQEVTISPTMRIFLLNDSQSLDEVVVTALGISREKKSLGYAVQSVESDELTKIRTGNVINSLAGRVAGVQVISTSGQLGGGAKINVRGNTSLTGNNQPLFVVDGIPISNEDYSTGGGAGSGYNQGNLASDISPDDIESMNILKGASATSLYGSRGANGVVLITTKKAAMGRKTFDISVNSSVTFDQAGIMPKYQKLYGGGDGDFSEITINGKTYNYPNLDVDESWGPKFDPNLMVLSWNSFDEWDRANYLVEKPWVYPKNDYTTFFKTGVAYNNNIQISGAGDSHSYRLSYSNLNQTGIYENSKLNRNNISFSGTAKITNALESFFTANYVNTSKLGSVAVGYEDRNPGKSIFQWIQTQLDYKELSVYKNLDGTQRPWNRGSYDDPTSPYGTDNPYWSLYENYEQDRRDRFFGSSGFSLTLADGLKLTGRAGIDAFMYKVETRYAFGSGATPRYDLINRVNIETSGDLYLNYGKRFMEDQLGISAMAGGGSYDRNYSYTGGYTESGLVVQGVYNLGNSVAKATARDYKYQKRINSMYGNVTFDWNMMVYLDITARNDWSSTLPTENNSYFYPSFNLSFILSQLNGLNELQWLNFAKVRAGYAEVGNDTDPYRLQNYYTFEPPFGSSNRFSISTTLNNPNLRPERTKSWEVGLEAQLFNNRLGVDIAYFQKSTIDQIIDAAISTATGYTRRYINAGELSNKGIELTLNASILRSRNSINWDMQFNLATLKNKVVSIAPDIDYIQLGSNGFSVYAGAFVGESYPIIYGKNYVYGENGEKLIGTNGRPLGTTGNEPLGKVTPDFNAGFSNTFSYKGIDLSILFDMQMGGHIYYLSHKYGMGSGILEESARPTNVPGKTGDVREDGWIFDGVLGRNVFDEATGKYVPTYIDASGNTVSTPVKNDIPVDGYRHAWMYAYGGVDAMNVFKSDYIKLREVRLGYTLPNKLTGPVKNLRISAFGRNLATFMTDQKHFDPEYLQMAGSNAQGLEGGYVPTTRSYGISIGFNFQ